MSCKHGGSSRKLCNKTCDPCLKKSFKSCKLSKYWSTKNKITARQVFKGTDKSYIFDCDICNHSFTKRISRLIDKLGCPYCTKKKICVNDCDTCHENSFASSDKVSFLTDKNTKKARDILKTGGTVLHFKCNKCDHEFSNTAANITKRGDWCPYCGNQKLCMRRNCKICCSKSFMTHDKAGQWSKRNIRKPHEVFRSSNSNFLFICDVCDHEFSASLDHIVKGTWCPFCANKELCDDLYCFTCYEKSFQSHEQSIYWSTENELKSRFVFKKSEKKILFNCNICNDVFSIGLDCVVRGHWCTCIVNKTETKLYNWLKAKEYDVEKQVKFGWCKNPETNRHLPFDFVIEEYKTIVELDGLQHFMQVLDWASPEKTRKNDVYKMKQALKNGYSIIRLLQEDVWKDKNDWKEHLIKKIKDYNEPKCIYLDNKDEYSVHKKMMNATK